MKLAEAIELARASMSAASGDTSGVQLSTPTGDGGPTTTAAAVVTASTTVTSKVVDAKFQLTQRFVDEDVFVEILSELD